jgi:hypothetical protein
MPFVHGAELLQGITWLRWQRKEVANLCRQCGTIPFDEEPILTLLPSNLATETASARPLTLSAPANFANRTIPMTAAASSRRPRLPP